jgi:hypothetical protein
MGRDFLGVRLPSDSRSENPRKIEHEIYWIDILSNLDNNYFVNENFGRNANAFCGVTSIIGTLVWCLRSMKSRRLTHNRNKIGAGKES